MSGTKQNSNHSLDLALNTDPKAPRGLNWSPSLQEKRMERTIMTSRADSGLLVGVWADLGLTAH